MRNPPYLYSQCQKPCSMSEVEQIEQIKSIFHARTFSEHAIAKHQDEMPQSWAQTSA